MGRESGKKGGKEANSGAHQPTNKKKVDTGSLVWYRRFIH